MARSSYLRARGRLTRCVHSCPPGAARAGYISPTGVTDVEDTATEKNRNHSAERPGVKRPDGSSTSTWEGPTVEPILPNCYARSGRIAYDPSLAPDDALRRIRDLLCEHDQSEGDLHDQ
jgi:hypothetical protein